MVWVLKCDIRKFFDSIDHEILINLLSKKLDSKTLFLLKNIINSFEAAPGKGIPIGNLTSQLFSNIYLNELDNFVKRRLRAKYYIRYADDFVILSRDKNILIESVRQMVNFLTEQLKLKIHQDKLMIRKWIQGIDFLGYNIFPHHKILRTKTKRRILKKISKKQREFLAGEITKFSFSQSIQSYLGMLKHCRGRRAEKYLNTML